jgi:hypothetical protein
MAKNDSSEELALRWFLYTMAGLACYVGAVFVFVL